MKYSILSILLTILFTVPLHAEKMRIAVMDFKAKGVADSLAQNVAELIRGEMINTGKFTVIERAQMNQILKEHEVGQSGCTDVSCAVEVGKMLSARKILIGTVMKMGGVIIITARIVNVESGAGEFSEKEKARSESQLYEAVSRFTQKLTQRIEGKAVSSYEGLTTEEESSVKTTEVDQPFRYDSWYMGMAYLFGPAYYDVGSGFHFGVAISGNNSFRSIFHIGLRLGFLAAGDGGEDGEYTDLDEGLYAGDIGGVIAQLTMGVNLRTQSKWFGVKLYAGLGFFGGNMTLYSSYYNEWAEEMQLYETDFDVDYSTFYYSIGVELPMGAGEKFCGPFIEITILPTPGSKDIRKAIEDEYGYYEGESPEMEEGSVVMLAFGFSHYW